MKLVGGLGLFSQGLLQVHVNAFQLKLPRKVIVKNLLGQFFYAFLDLLEFIAVKQADGSKHGSMPEAALQIVRSQSLVKGYGLTENLH